MHTCFLLYQQAEPFAHLLQFALAAQPASAARLTSKQRGCFGGCFGRSHLEIMAARCKGVFARPVQLAACMSLESREAQQLGDSFYLDAA